MGKVTLDKRFYLQFEDSWSPSIELIDSMAGQKHKKGTKHAGKPMSPVHHGYFSSILAALKYYANIKTARSKDMDVQQLVSTLSGAFKRFNDVNWLELSNASKEKSNVKGAN